MRGWLRSTVRTTGLALIGAALAVGAATAAQAEAIDAFTVDARVGADTRLTVVETIVYDFEGAYRHGIFRDIPEYDETFTGQRRSYDVDVVSITMDAGPVPWEESTDGPFRHLRIGDPDRTITGPHTYVITYTVDNALRVITTDDGQDPLLPSGISVGDVELYWDFVGSGWQVPIGYAATDVAGPGPVVSSRCYTGPVGSTLTCPTASVGSTATLGPVSLSPGEPLTGAVVFPAAAFTSTPVENIRQGIPSSPALGVGLALIPAAAVIAVPVVLAVSRRREDKGVVIPGAPPQYAPPDDLAPAQLAAAWKGRAWAGNARVMLATLLDLAARRWIDVSSVDGKHLTVTWVGTGDPALRPWEERLLALILKGQQTATLAGYDAELAKGWKARFNSLVTGQESAGRRNAKGGDPDRRWNRLGIVAVLTLVLAFVSLFFGSGFISAVLFTLGGAALVAFVAARIITPRRETERSALFLAKVAGFEKVLGTDPAAARREFAQRSGLTAVAIFATMLPYAVVFDLEKSWIGAFPDLTPDDLVNTGFHVASIGAMDSFMSSSTSSMSSATTAPSSGSGGGGSSGGGGGGGGGGSW